MAVTVVLPGLLAQDAGGRSRIELPSPGTAGEVLEALFERCPRLRQRICTDRGEVRPHVNVFVENESIRAADGLATPVPDGCELFVLPAISGGSCWST